MMSNKEELYHRLDQAFAHSLKAHVDAIKEYGDDRARLDAEGFTQPQLPPELLPLFNEYFNTVVSPKINITRKTILEAVAQVLAETLPPR